MRILKPDEVSRIFQIGGDINNDQPLTLPLITLSRESQVEILAVNKKTMSYDGLMVQSKNDKTLQINAIPIKIAYQLDIYTRRFEEGDEYVRNFVFNLINHPTLTIEIPYNNLQYHHDSHIILDANVQDNSDIPQKLFSDQFTRWTISFTIDDAYLFSVPVENNLSIDEGEVEIKEN